MSAPPGLPCPLAGSGRPHQEAGGCQQREDGAGTPCCLCCCAVSLAELAPHVASALSGIRKTCLSLPLRPRTLVFLWSLVSGGLRTRVCFLTAAPPPLYVLPSLESLHATTRWALSSAGAMPDGHLTPTPLVSTPLLRSHGTLHISH